MADNSRGFSTGLPFLCIWTHDEAEHHGRRVCWRKMKILASWCLRSRRLHEKNVSSSTVKPGPIFHSLQPMLIVYSVD